MTVLGPLSLEALRRQHPEWATWLTLYAIARGATDDETWTAALPAAPAGHDGARPLITGALFVADARAVARLVSALLKRVGAPPLGAEAAIAALDAAVAQDDQRLRAIASAADIDEPLLVALAPLMAMPLLQDAHRVRAGRRRTARRRDR